jgi:hypothetical protein
MHRLLAAMVLMGGACTPVGGEPAPDGAMHEGGRDPEESGRDPEDAGSRGALDASPAPSTDAMPPDGPRGGDADGGGAAPRDPRAPELLEDVSRTHLDSFAGRSPAIWSEAAILETLVVLYEATADPRVLDELSVHLDALLAHRSSEQGIEDVLRQEPVPAWGTDAYSCGRYYVHAVHTGVLTYPMAWFAATVAEKERLAERHGERARRYGEAASRAVEVHEGQFVSDGSGGHYRAPTNLGELGRCDGEDPAERAGDPLPFNMMLAVGRTHVELAQLYRTQGASEAASHHRGRAARLARRFRAALRPVSDRYDWDYRPGGRPEDTAHGSLDARFVAHAHAHEIVFTEDELGRLARTFRWLTGDPARVRSHVAADYGSAGGARWQRAAPRWLPVSQVDRTVYDRARNIYYNHEGDTVLARALLLRWKPDARTYPIRGRDLSDELVAHDPMGAVQPARWTGLYRTSDMPARTFAGTTVTSCARYVFDFAQRSRLMLRYRHTREPVAGDGCGGDACGTAPGVVVLTRHGDAGWERTAAPAPEAETYRTHRLDPPMPYTELAVCRSGAGHARDNLQIGYVAAE